MKLRWLLLAALLAACAEGPYRPDVVILSIDSLSREALPGYGGEGANAPTLERLASRSLRFANAYSTASWTLPAHASLLTGLYPDRHGATDPRVLLAAELPRLAPQLREAGYSTVAFTDGAYLDWRYGFGPGFERYDDFVAPTAPAIEVPRGGLPHEEKGTTLFDRAIAYLESRAADEPPLFLFLHTYSVHDYFRLHAWATARAPGAELRETSGYLRCLLGLEACSDRDWEVLRALYAAEVAHLDRGVARLLDVLERTGRADGTLLIFLSDHGESFDRARGRLHHGGRLHQDQLRIPLFMHGPGIAPGEIDAPISLVDLMPTLLDLLGLPIPEGLDGRSLVPAIRREAELAAVPLYAMEHYHLWYEGVRKNSPEVQPSPLSVAVIQGRNWYIRAPFSEELYDMEADPEQDANLSADERRVAGLRELSAARRQLAVQREPSEQDPELLEQLRALGYVE